MAGIPASARWLAGAASAVFLVPFILTALTRGVSGQLYLCAIGLLTGAFCTVPVFYRRRDRFRVACAAAGFSVAAVWVPVLVIGLLAALGLGAWDWFLGYLALPLAAIAALIGAFQRAYGPDSGRSAVAVGWAAAAVSAACWFPLAF
ncbi:hypothetical protein ABTZ03_21785 [Kitasatospora sp. NPDC096077]|uniref:hypothetical protein n=1 Tax=Kitasatospora sp. NPDC096077 TaxID=3155544 RepID=UPI00332D390B